MKILRGVLVSAVLLGCGADSREPVQPQFDVTSSGLPSANGVANGPPNAGFYAAGSTGGSTIPIGLGFTEILKFPSLPPGSYLANADAVIASNFVPDVHFVDCGFTLGGGLQGQISRGMVGGILVFQSLPLTTGFTITTPTDLAIACRSDIAGVVSSQGSNLTAIRVVSLSQSIN